MTEVTVSENNVGVDVIHGLSTRVNLTGTEVPTLLVTETFGTTLLGEGAMTFIPDARDRLARGKAQVLPAGGCQYATLVGVRAGAPNPFATDFPSLRDIVYWKFLMTGVEFQLEALSERICVLEVDFESDMAD